MDQGFAKAGTALALFALLSACAARRAEERRAQEAARLHNNFHRSFEETLELDAVFASEIGDDRYNDRLNNFLSPEFRERKRRHHQRWLDEVRLIDESLLSRQDRLSREIFVLEQEKELDGLRFPSHLLPVSQLFSVPSLFAKIASGRGDHPFRSERDYRDFLSRIEAWVPVSRQIITNLRQGMRQGVVQPRVLIEKALPELESLATGEIEESLFYGPLERLPEGMDEAARERLRDEYATALREQLQPSYRAIYDFVRDEYLPACRETVGMWALPEGRAWYAHRIRVQTTTDRGAEEIHRLGRREVERLRGEMVRVVEEAGFGGTLEEFLHHLETDPRFYFTDPEDLLQAYRDVRPVVEARLPELFDLAPRTDYEILPVPAVYAAQAPAAIYDQGSADGTRPAAFYVNTSNLPTRPSYQIEALFLHEASPGHHFQGSVIRGLEELPAFRRYLSLNAYFEGWALYAESLGWELGLYRDPYQRYGQLHLELLRAMRLVVDTGLHHYGWSADEAVAYMTRHSSLSRDEATVEVERYIAWPAQALGYTLGKLTISGLRSDAERQLGDRFDVKAFHREILVDGPLPLEVLEAKVGEWIAASKDAG